MKNKKTVLVLVILILFSLHTVGVYASQSYTTLRFGSRGNEVVKLQEALQNKNYYHSSTDGIYGRITERSVTNFQKDKKITIDGIAGRQTQSLLYANTSNSYYSLLRFGSRGNEVVKLQETLRNKNYYHSSIDGIYGRITERSVMNFQRDKKITIDGIAGRQTQSLLYGATGTTSRSNTMTTQSYNSDDLYWLSRIIHSESQGEPYNGKVAVGNVVINRVNSREFPNTIYNVIFEYYKSIPQFSPVANGTIYNTPSQLSIQAAQEALNGSRPVGISAYFFNPDKATGTWIVSNKTYLTRIGNHVFYQ